MAHSEVFLVNFKVLENVVKDYLDRLFYIYSIRNKVRRKQGHEIVKKCVLVHTPPGLCFP